MVYYTKRYEFSICLYCLISLLSYPILSREDEERRIKQLGGKVIHWGRWRVQGVLAVSRAIGDVALQPYVTCEPEIIEKEISTSSLV